jgi:signal peptidase I
MYPTFLDKEYILTNIITLRFNKPKQGDVIVFKAPPDPEKDYIKRIIGIPGDTVLIKNGNVYINSKLLNENVYLDPTIKTYPGSFLAENVTVKVPANSYFVLGDNRTGSSDSREWGFVSFGSIVGESMFVYWPFNKMGVIKNPFGK